MYAKKTILFLPIEKMSVFVKRNMNCRYENVRKLLNLSLCKQSRQILCEKNTWNRRTLSTVQNFTEKYKDSQPNKNASHNNLSQNSEQSMLYSILQNSSFYTHTIVPPIKSQFYVTKDTINNTINMISEQSTSVDCLNAVKIITHYYLNGSYLTEENYCKILNVLAYKLPEFKDDEITKLMPFLIVLKDKVATLKSYRDVINVLNTECLKRFFSSNISQLLLTVDAFFQLNAQTSYMWRALRKVGSKFNKLTGKNFVQLLFYLPSCKVPDLHMFELECHLNECMHEISANELGIVARGFFLTKKRINHADLMKNIMKKIEEHISSMSNISIATVMKLIRYSDACFLKEDFEKALKTVTSEVDRLSLTCLTHIAQAMAGTHICNSTLLNKIVDRLEDEHSLARIKDIERIMYCICTITPYTQGHDMCNRIVNLLLSTYKTTRAKEISLYPYSMVRIIGFLTLKNIYVEELIKFVLRPEYVQNAYKYNMKFLTFEYLALHCSLKIELPNYTGPVISHEIHNCLVQKFCSKHIVDKGHSMKFRSEIVYMCKEKLGLDAHVDFILPHYFSPDIIFGFDKNDNPVPIKSILSEMQLGSIKRVDSTDLREIKWKIIFLLTNTHEVLGHKGYIGPVYTKFRQLKAIGYIPIPLHYSAWKKLDIQNKVLHLKDIIFQENTEFLQN